ncbi:MAG: protease pro-enzyme activation domain-containing protein, partial [Steroidobacteraceae bacterium]
MQLTRIWVAAAFAAAVISGISSAPVLARNQPAIVDLGAADNIAGQSQMSVTVSLKLRNTDQMESMLQAVYTAGGPSYRKFLTPQQFIAKFGPTAATVARVTQHFQKAGLQVAQTTGTHLSVSGGTAALQSEFGVQLHAFEVAPTATAPGYRFHSPMGAPQIASDIADAVQSVDGLDTRPRFRPHLAHTGLAQSDGRLLGLPAAATPSAANQPGSLTVTDFAKHYDVNPLYHAGVDGNGATIGIVTLASFTPSDAYAYWKAVGLNVKSNRIREVQIDGGSGPVSDAGGSLETTLDVEQSGGLSPASKVVV